MVFSVGTRQPERQMEMTSRIYESIQEAPAITARGVVKGRWAGNTCALIELHDGRLVEARGPWQIVGRIALGQDVTVFFNAAGRVAGWTPESSRR